MKAILRIRVDTADLVPGFIPLYGLPVLREFVAAVREHGSHKAAWQGASLQLSIEGAKSTDLAIFAPDEVAEALEHDVVRFSDDASRFELTGKGRKLVLEHFGRESQWKFLEFRNGHDVAVRFDPDYREELLRKEHAFTGTDEVYAYVARVGGSTRPRVQLEIEGLGLGTYDVQSRDLAIQLGKSLYQTVKLQAEVTWDSETLAIIHLRIIGLDPEWRDVHLSDVLQQHDGILPLGLNVRTVEELIAQRDQDRSENGDE